MTESLEIQEMLRVAMRDRYGEAALAHRFRAFDTICSATQDRQDAVGELLAAGGLDLMIVVGGYNSSNTQALAAMCAPALPSFHVEDLRSIEADAITHRPMAGGAAVTTMGWLPRGGVSIGVTSGASTPDSVVGEVVEKILRLRGHAVADLVGQASPEDGHTIAAVGQARA
jgi:4-hydroxy-3-methylbut-2-en-1-yl diphosphate reductase